MTAARRAEIAAHVERARSRGWYHPEEVRVFATYCIELLAAVAVGSAEPRQPRLLWDEEEA